MPVRLRRMRVSLRHNNSSPFLARHALSTPKGRESSGWSKGFTSTLLDFALSRFPPGSKGDPQRKHYEPYVQLQALGMGIHRVTLILLATGHVPRCKDLG